MGRCGWIIYLNIAIKIYLDVSSLCVDEFWQHFPQFISIGEMPRRRPGRGTGHTAGRAPATGLRRGAAPARHLLRALTTTRTLLFNAHRVRSLFLMWLRPFHETTSNARNIHASAVASEVFYQLYLPQGRGTLTQWKMTLVRMKSIYQRVSDSTNYMKFTKFE